MNSTIPAPVDPETLAIALAPLARLAPSRTEVLLALVKSTLTPLPANKPDLSWVDGE